MLVLDQGALSGFGCGQRMGIVFLGAVVAQFAMVGFGVFWWKGDGDKVETLRGTPFFTPARVFLAGIWVLVTLIVAIICMLLRTETMISTDDNSVVETSCYGPFSGDYQLDRSKTVVHYITEISSGKGGRTHELNYLALEEAGKDRQLYIVLDGSHYLSNLEQFAPRAISSYRDYLKQNQRPSSPQTIVRTP
ncbi:hypothetical protein DTW90_09660 [Neorhizobium sp. P12A]|jgi:hypothetical protein|uniref:hypothetical protein n=1 Tax=Rhizobium/Agrobacterium group TaxID=227290 RepID=UPI00105399B7|nr:MULTISPECIES: hypothetical protein [Rhizobium/Agrobacterium group]KAA0699619.1 hypothetical protein DTW90_09660 [Neorhizobium sp. P12A]TCR91244.1 hypothetical protein EV561_103642 [Rhizobium sp. BK376]